MIVVRWKPPNTAESSIQHYVIDSPSGSFITRNTSIEIALLVYHCEVETYIRIHAVDYCDRNGLQTNGILAQLLTSTNITSVPFTASTTEIDNNDDSFDQSEFMIPGSGWGKQWYYDIVVMLNIMHRNNYCIGKSAWSWILDSCSTVHCTSK